MRSQTILAALRGPLSKSLHPNFGDGGEDLVGRPVRAFEVALDMGTMGFMYHLRRLDWLADAPIRLGRWPGFFADSSVHVNLPVS